MVFNFFQAQSSESCYWLIISNRKMHGQLIIGTAV